MALFFLGLLMLVQWPCTLVAGSVLTHSKDCGSDHLAYVKTSDEYYLFINQKRLEGHGSICGALESNFANGCLFCDSQVEAWGRIGKKYCDRDFSVDTHVECNTVSVDLLHRAGRKLLRQISAKVSIDDGLSGNVQSQEEKQLHNFSLASHHVTLAVSGMLLLCCSLLCPCFRAKRKDISEQTVLAKELNSIDSVSSFEVSSPSERPPATPLRVPPSPSRFSLSPQLSRIGSIHLSVNQIVKATQNFSPSVKLGEGGFGTVYKAELPDGQFVAIKRGKKEHFASLRTEFSNEVELLAKIEHRNLVKLLGYTEKGNERIIITEFVPNGTLREHLDGQHGKILDFNQRLEIAIDVAHGLTYLHLYAEKTIIHRDVKSSNILLTESFRAKVADFGFARSGPTNADQTHISTNVKGTAGYLDPEYLKTYQLTPKSDVFSYGILLIEILSARRPVELRRAVDERITVRWAFKKYNEGNVRDILDPLLEEAVDGEVLTKMLGLAFQCAAPTRSDRPAMKEVGEELWEIRKDYVKSLRRVDSSSSSHQR